MNPNPSINSLLNRLWRHISPNRRHQFLILLIMMSFVSFTEILSIGAVLPFLGILTDPERIFKMPHVQPIVENFRLTDPKQLLLPFTVAFGLAALIAGVMRLLLLWLTTRLSFATGTDLSIDIYRRTLYQPFTVHCDRNSSEVIDGISAKANGVIYSIIFPILTVIGSCILLIAILIVLLMVQPLIALITFGGFGFIYIVIIRLTRKQLMVDSKCVARESSHVIKSLQEGLGGIRDVLIDGSQEAYCKIYRDADASLRRAQSNIVFIGASPRYGMEALGMLLISALAYSLAQQEDGIAEALPILGALALGAQRMLPVLQQAYGSWTQINSGRASLKDTLELLDQPIPSYVTNPVPRLPFNQAITISKLKFRYGEEGPDVINHIDLTITKGSRIGIIGATGGGKSTLIDIVMGLLQPTDGVLMIDGQPITLANQRAWQSHIAHVPQVIFLADSTIEENIAFGIPVDQIDHSRVREAARQAQIADSIESWPKQYQTFVGERGIRLSGGQRQRIGIARALYKRADVIIFDEATSALDGKTEEAVMNAINSLNKNLTLIIIAHRLTTLKNCTQIIELSNGDIRRCCNYQDVLHQQ
ncbi:ABC transporter ATP-binding protein [Polynucleobacter alcilacus]|uniref:ABC transporter ATP-binding protein n=1 Tax=Polynucleobacter alcilacus TaxID=1819739 RepID=UPI001C0AABA2|nr:ABC transporter ATP-binding protein [Polynucleobacter alcilacus]MBU3568167.1 ABC transporter ATP-binding protein [Polynucleobacter alcilacus]